MGRASTMFIQNRPRQPIQTPISVPHSGPARLEASSSVEIDPSPIVRCEAGRAWAAIASPTGTSAPPPSAVTALAIVRIVMLGANATNTEPPMKMSIPITKMR